MVPASVELRLVLVAFVNAVNWRHLVVQWNHRKPSDGLELDVDVQAPGSSSTVSPT
jgi:hypothetical protein